MISSRFQLATSYARVLWILAGLVTVGGCRSNTANIEARQEKVLIFVAASTKEAVEQIAKDFQAETGIAVEVSPGPSSGLVKQIEQVRPADLFLSADRPNADHLEGKGLIELRRVLLRNRLVIVAPADSSLELKGLGELADPKVKKLALAEEKVPAGEYSREVLKNAGIWDRVRDRVVGGTDVRITMQLVEQGVDAGFVYVTDAVASSKVRVVLEVDPQLHKSIEYPLVLVKRPAVKESAKRFYEYLGSEKAAAIFRQARFEVAR